MQAVGFESSSTFMPALALHIPLVFVATTVMTGWFFWKAIRGSGFFVTQQRAPIFVLLSVLWLATQATLSLNGFYQDTRSLPPKFLLAPVPPVLFLVVLFFASRQFLERLSAEWLTYLHVIRIPVELVLLWLYYAGTIPREMTFEGRNFDVLIGITAPFMAYFGYTQVRLTKPILLIWNVIGLLFLGNVVLHGILALPSPFQVYAFQQPNIAVLNFPFIWLPSYIVPLVLMAHVVSIRQLLK